MKLLALQKVEMSRSLVAKVNSFLQSWRHTILQCYNNAAYCLTLDACLTLKQPFLFPALAHPFVTKVLSRISDLSAVFQHSMYDVPVRRF